VRKKPSLREADIQHIQDLYFEEGWSQNEINDQYFGHSNSGYVSHIINGDVISLEAFLAPKLKRMQDSITFPKNKRQRSARRTREKHPMTKLTWQKVATARKQYFAGKITQKDIAQRLDIAQSTVCRFLNGSKWKQQ
jgi:hypothetical protein